MDCNETIEEYLVRRAKQCMTQRDSYMAKAWFLTAANLCPFSFKIQFERYLMAKEEHNVSEASKYFITLLSQEKNDSKNNEIDQEMSNVVDAIKSNKSNGNSAFYRQLFEYLSPKLQQQLLVTVVNKYTETSDICQLTLLILKRFPERINEDGLKLIEILTSESEETDHSTHSPKFYRQLLVFDVLPVILSPNSNFEITEQKLYKLLEKTIAFYIDVNLSQHATDSEIDDKLTTNGENSITRFRSIFQLIARKLNWDLLIFDEGEEDSFDIQYQKIFTFFNSLTLGDGANVPIDLSASNTNPVTNFNENSMKQVLYSVTILFLMCLSKYARETVGKLILVEKKLFSFNNDKPNKKRKTSYSFHSPEIHTSSDELKESLVVSVKCFELITNDYNLHAEFSKKIEAFGLLESDAYNSFLPDSHLYRASYEDLISHLTNSDSMNYKLKTSLQRISSSLMLFQDMNVIENCITCVSLVQKMTEKLEEEKHCFHSTPIPQSGARSLIFLNYGSEDILGYCVEALISCIKNKELLSLKPSDEGIGHLIVLSQYKWPKEVELFENCVAIIKKSSHSSQIKFVYPLFFDYIVNPDILEEFMALVNMDGLSIELKEQSSNVGTISKAASKSMTTRGCNKNVKDETRNSLMSQMRMSRIIIEKSLLINFILNEIKNYITR